MKKMSHWIIGVVTFLLIAVIGVGVGGSLIAYVQFQPVSSEKKEAERFVIPKGQAVAVIAERLQEEGLIKNAYAFRFVVKQQGLESKIQSGTFFVSPSMKLEQIAQVLTTGADDIWVTIPEGWRVEEIAESVASLDLPAFDEEEFIEISKGYEGLLFPDSYLIPREYTAEQLRDLLTATFDKKVNVGLADEIEASDREFTDVLVMASLVEREARDYQQMRRVAGILWNRIDIGMALQVDATLQYVEGYNVAQDSWWTPPSITTKQTTSRFNTYLNPGLPPHPISNPGMDALKATLDPLESDDIFYLHSRDGAIYYAQTLDEHNANIERYLR